VDDESVGSVDSLVRSVFQSVRAQLASFSTGAHVALAEIRVVASHAGLFLGLMIVAAGTALVSWVLVLLLGAQLLVDAGFSMAMALASMLALNLLALGAVCLYMRHTLKVISFRHTRNALGMDSGKFTQAE